MDPFLSLGRFFGCIRSSTKGQMPKKRYEAKELLQFRADPFYVKLLRDLVEVTDLDEADHLRCALTLYLQAVAGHVHSQPRRGTTSMTTYDVTKLCARVCEAAERLCAQARPPAIASPKFGRNDPCSCGSGRKYKFCCLGKGLISVDRVSHDAPESDLRSPGEIPGSRAFLEISDANSTGVGPQRATP
jgi:hypothetical protein